MVTSSPGPGLGYMPPIVREVASSEPELLDILKAAETRIAAVLNEGEVIKIEDDDFDQEVSATGYLVDFWAAATLGEMALYLVVSVLANENHNMISKCSVKCYIKVSKKQQQKWLDIFESYVGFFSNSEEYGEGNIVIGLCRSVGFRKELEAFLDGRSSKTPTEIKEMFEDFMIREPLGFPANIKLDLEVILADFLACVENYNPS